MGERGTKRITVIAGPARSGKTGRVVELFCEAHGAGRSAIVIAPDSACARSTRRRLLGSIDALPTDAVTTFVGLSERILAASGSPASLISAHERELLSRRIVADLSSSGRLRALSQAAEFDGFYTELAAFIRELKSCQIEPDAYRKAAFDGKAERDSELAEIYERYQDYLEKNGLYDTEGRFWQARVILENSKPGAAAYDTVFLDGFTDFTANEIALLRALSRHVGDVFVTLPYDSKRDELFAKTFQTMQLLKKDFAVRVEELTAPDGGNATSVICRSLMDGCGAVFPAPPAGGMRIISTAGARMEMEEIAHEAKRLVLAGRSTAAIAVVTRAPDAYRDVAREVFAEIGVPLDAGAALSFGGTGIRMLLAVLLDVAERDFEREAVIKALSSPYVDLPAFAGGELAGADVIRIARDAGVVRGFQQWRTRLEGLELLVRQTAEGDATERNEEDAKVCTGAADVERIAVLRNAVNRLKELVAPLERQASANALAGSFETIIETLGVRRRILEAGLPEDVLFRDLAAYAALSEALDALRRSRQAAPSVTSASFLAMVERIVDANASSGELSGGVVFLDAVTARNLSFPVVFLCGVLADAWPSRLPLGPFYSRSEREQLAKLGLVTRTEEAHVAAERLLFYQAVTRAEEILYVTYPATDEGGKPKLASFYLDDLKALFAFADGDIVARGPSRAVKPLEDAMSASEAGIAAGDLVAKADSPKEVAPLASLARSAGAPFDAALRAAAIEARRDSLEDFDSFDGRLSVRAAASVARRFQPGHEWSGTALNDYKKCPFVFFLNRVLCAERPEEPDVVPTPLERGAAAHDFLARFFTDLRDGAKLEAVLGGNDEGLEAAFEAVFRSVIGLRQRRLGLTGDPFWEIEKARIRAMLRDFVTEEIARLREAQGRYLPAFFELAFGSRARDAKRGLSDAASRSVPVLVEGAGQREALSGRIDRVDYVLADGGEKSAPRRTFIVDYKLSQKPTKSDVDSYRDMQMPVYLFAAPFVVPGKSKVFPAGGLYRTVKTAEGNRPVKSFDDEKAYEGFCSEFAGVLFETVREIREGHFAAAPESGCSDNCPGRGVCRLNETRMEFLREKHGQDRT